MRSKTILLSLLALFLMVSLASASNVIDNTKKVSIYVENTQTLAHDNFGTAMFFEYNPRYLFNDTIAGNLSKSNTDLLVIDSDQMSNASISVVNSYIASGGCVWDLVDPIHDENGVSLFTQNRIPVLEDWNQVDVSPGRGFNFNTSDPIGSGIPSSINSINPTEVYDWSKSMSAYGYDAGTGFYHSEVCSSGTSNAVLVDYYNPTTGSKVIYSNPDVYISGGYTNYFNSTIATKLFIQSKAWILGLDTNTYNAAITYPKSSKQFVLTLDDGHASYTEFQQDSNFFNVTNSYGYPIPQTWFIVEKDSSYIPPTDLAGLNAFTSQNADVHTVHPHGVNNQPDLDWTIAATATDYNVSIFEAVDNACYGSNFGFYSFRFPGTKGTPQAFQIFSNRGYIASSDYGPYTGMGPLGSLNQNNVFFAKQEISYDKEAPTIEYEDSGHYDINEPALSNIYSERVGLLGEFYNINFPSVFIQGAHEGTTAQNPVALDNQTKLFNYIDTSNSDLVYNSLATIALYTQAVKNANIKTVSITNGIQTTITTATQINNFTIKMSGIQNGIHAQLDGADLGLSNVRFEDGNYYVFATIPTGTHTLTVTDTNSFSTSGTWISKAGTSSLPIFDNTQSIKNNAGSTQTETVTSIYNGVNNSISGSTNTFTIPRQGYVTKLPVQITTSGGTVTFNVSKWTSTSKVWSESSSTHNAVASHSIGGFPANSVVNVYCDGALNGTFTSDSTGAISFYYTGYSSHVFDSEVAGAGQIVKTSTTNNSATTLATSAAIFGLIVIVMFMRLVINAFKGNGVNIKELEFTMFVAIVGIAILVMGAIMIGSLSTLG